jgi:predicted component of type VI protein secretion system
VEDNAPVLPLVIRLKRPTGATQMFAFADSPIRIGRSPLNHLQLDEQYISRIEAVVRFDAKEVSYFHVGRTNVTLLDGRPVPPDAEVVLDERSDLVIGKLQLRFSREAVDDAKVIRRVSHVPRGEEAPHEALHTTVFEPSAGAPAAPEQHAAAPRPGAGARPGQAAQASPVSVPMRMIPIGESVQPPAARAPQAHAQPRQREHAYAATPTPTPARSSPEAGSPATRFGHAEYRRAWQGFLRELEAELLATPEPQRAELADQLQKDYPQIVREQDFRDLLGRLGLTPRKPGDPEIERWLRTLGKGLFPPGVRLETGMTIERLGALLQMFSQVFVEIQSAQSDARKEMALQANTPGSLLSSEDPNVILAYLLNPNVDGAARLAELEQCVTKLAVHEAALFGAIKDGAQALLEALSPDSVALEEARSSGEDHGMLSRVFGSKQDAADARLWRRYVQMHADLMDGKQYQRRFIGREFARLYLRAMEKLAPDL